MFSSHIFVKIKRKNAFYRELLYRREKYYGGIGMDKRKVVVDIFGEQFFLKTDSEEEYVKKLAEIVDLNMRDVARKTRTFSGSRLGVLAALQIADDYFRLKSDYDELLDLMKKK